VSPGSTWAAAKYLASLRPGTRKSLQTSYSGSGCMATGCPWRARACALCLRWQRMTSGRFKTGRRDDGCDHPRRPAIAAASVAADGWACEACRPRLATRDRGRHRSRCDQRRDQPAAERSPTDNRVMPRARGGLVLRRGASPVHARRGRQDSSWSTSHAGTGCVALGFGIRTVSAVQE